MRGILDQRERMNLPAGMSELDLMIYSPVLYDLYRNEGEGFDKDAFRFDPIVSTGMLASDYALAKGLAWVNYLTPESLGAINPGDNLVVPVQTFDNYKNLPPWEKKLTHEVSYNGESNYSANLLNLEASKVGMKNNFVGDFSYYFDKESRLLGTERLAVATALEEPTTGIIPRPRVLVSAATNPKPITNIIETVPVVPVKPRVTVIATQVSNTPGLVPAVTSTPSTPSTPTTTTSTPPSDVINGGYLPSSGGGAMASGGGEVASGGGEIASGGQEESAPSESSTENSASGGGDYKKTALTAECKINYIPVVIGFIVLGIIGYVFAKQNKKDVKKYSIAGAVIGVLLGYVYAKHQCTPVEALRKIGIKSKIESNYYGGR